MFTPSTSSKGGKMKSLQLFAFRALLRLKKLCERVNHYFFGSKISTFLQWSQVSLLEPYHSLWSSYNRFFYCQGYTLWRRHGVPELLQMPPNDNPRTPDGFSYHAYDDVHENTFYFANAKMHAARTADNRDVVIVLLSDGVTGVNTVEALQTVGTGISASIDRNHTLPVLQFLRHRNFTFGVFPMVGSASTIPWFRYMDEALEFMSQIMEGGAFLHDHRVVHRDLFISNFLTSRRDGWPNPSVVDDAKAVRRARYYIIDFEWAIRFSPNADPADCKVIGPPLPWKRYGRPAPPEMRSNEPHCPFKADVWQLGYAFLECFQHLEGIPEIIKLLELMHAENPDTRPTVHNAVERLINLRYQVPYHILHQAIEEAT